MTRTPHRRCRGPRLGVRPPVGVAERRGQRLCATCTCRARCSSSTSWPASSSPCSSSSGSHWLAPLLAPASAPPHWARFAIASTSGAVRRPREMAGPLHLDRGRRRGRGDLVRPVAPCWPSAVPPPSASGAPSPPGRLVARRRRGRDARERALVLRGSAPGVAGRSVRRPSRRPRASRRAAVTYDRADVGRPRGGGRGQLHHAGPGARSRSPHSGCGRRGCAPRGRRTRPRRRRAPSDRRRRGRASCPRPRTSARPGGHRVGGDPRAAWAGPRAARPT